LYSLGRKQRIGQKETANGKKWRLNGAENH
jgi:hypothetical protein